MLATGAVVEVPLVTGTEVSSVQVVDSLWTTVLVLGMASVEETPVGTELVGYSALGVEAT